MYIYIDGNDGTGKDTQADLLVSALQKRGLNPLRVNEPDSSLPTGALLRQFLKSGEFPESHAALFLADRMALLARKVKPALEAGRPVVSVRSFMSTLVYQQEHWPLSWLIGLHTQLPVKADKMFILDMDPAKSLARTVHRNAPEVYEKLGIQQRNRVRYKELSSDFRVQSLLGPKGIIHVLDAEQSPEQVHARLLNLYDGGY